MICRECSRLGNLFEILFEFLSTFNFPSIFLIVNQVYSKFFLWLKTKTKKKETKMKSNQNCCINPLHELWNPFSQIDLTWFDCTTEIRKPIRILVMYSSRALSWYLKCISVLIVSNVTASVHWSHRHHNQIREIRFDIQYKR